MKYAYLVTSHGNAHLSGVAKFNSLLARKLSVTRICVQDFKKIEEGPVLFSFKLNDQNANDQAITKELISSCIRKHIVFDVFFHTFDSLDIEQSLIKACRYIYCGNEEIFEAVCDYRNKAVHAWCPALVDFDKSLTEHDFNIFSFGMAHKIHVEYYNHLYQLMEDRNIDYTIWVSTAFHEKANFGDYNLISDELEQIFGKRIQFLGFLSDSAVNYFLDKSDLFVAFFNKGVRANNTSIHAALDRGCAILTNCDQFSPGWMQHGHNILDIHQTRPDDLNREGLEKIRKYASHDSQTHAGWDNLVKIFKTSE